MKPFPKGVAALPMLALAGAINIMAQVPQHSADIKVNQAGYPPAAPKVAVVTSALAEPPTIHDAKSGTQVMQAKAADPMPDADSGDTTIRVDFSALKQPGEYYLQVPGVGASYPFTVAADVYHRPLYLAMRSFYGQRCGIAVDLGPEFPGYRYGACHHGPASYHQSTGRSGEVDVTGGWHDAGDYGRYIVNSGITTGTLLWAFELNRANLEKFNLATPESGGKLPDMLAEIKWNLDWMLKMQDEDGGVWHKSTSARFCGFVMPPEDTSPVLVIGSGREPYKVTTATADFAAVCAAAARAYRPYDAAYADHCLAAAERAWEWLAKTPDSLYRRNPEGIQTGGYGDGDDNDERLWAAAELFRTTGKAPYNTYFLENYTKWTPTIGADSPPGWPNVQQLGMFTYALAKDADEGAVARIRADAVAAADAMVARAAANGYLIPLKREQYIWGSNSVVLNYAMVLLLANRLQPNEAYVNTALDSLHYVLGRNTFDTSFVTHVGTNWAMRPHHRPSGADGIDQPWPGLIVGGPNSRNEMMRGKPADPNRPPAKAWIDDQASFSTNENAINWNAPLVFVLSEFAR